MTHLAKDEVLHRMNVLSELGVFPTSMTKFASIVNQKYHGDIKHIPGTHFLQLSTAPGEPDNGIHAVSMSKWRAGDMAKIKPHPKPLRH